MYSQGLILWESGIWCFLSLFRVFSLQILLLSHATNLNYGTNIAAKAGISNHGDAHITLRFPDQQKRVADILVGRPIILYGAFVYVPVAFAIER